tara:strand:- start:271 stop:504 length:234 start_codon:yes stop_codon:yes gene_type:complete
MDPIYAWLHYFPRLTTKWAKTLGLLAETTSSNLTILPLAISRKSFWTMRDTKGKQFLLNINRKVYAQLITDTPDEVL